MIDLILEMSPAVLLVPLEPKIGLTDFAKMALTDCSLSLFESASTGGASDDLWAIQPSGARTNNEEDLARPRSQQRIPLASSHRAGPSAVHIKAVQFLDALAEQRV